jgi:hypothetical protein
MHNTWALLLCSLLVESWRLLCFCDVWLSAMALARKLHTGWLPVACEAASEAATLPHRCAGSFLLSLQQSDAGGV